MRIKAVLLPHLPHHRRCDKEEVAADLFTLQIFSWLREERQRQPGKKERGILEGGGGGGGERKSTTRSLLTGSPVAFYST